MLTRLLVAAVIGFATVSATAVNVVIDYTYAPVTGSGFFNPNTTNGQAARATLESVADFYSAILDDSLVEVRKPDDYISTAPGGSPVSYSWNWEARFENPTTGGNVSISNPVIPADEYRIYVGARSLPGSTLGFAGPGGWGSSEGGSWYFPDQRADIQQISDDFSALLTNRSQADGDFGSWGGVVTFDTGSVWNYDHTVEPTFGQNDLLSVALHELAHTFGFATSDEFTALRSGSLFLGDSSRAANNGVYPTLTEDGHWSTQTPESDVFGGSGSNEASLEPSITTGTRRLLTELDAGALADIGWELVVPPLAGDYNADGLVDAADYTVWRDSLGGTVVGTRTEWANNYGASGSATTTTIPEPTSLLLVIAGLVANRTRR